ncbi:MAG: tRNA (adenosine(37)-N6)-threonylcarbamoyltransferase complex ATPase subunit type 1 TsaE [Balneolales bacterium]
MTEVQKTYVSTSPDDTLSIGRSIAGLLKPGDAVCLFGELGAGKTHLAKGIASGFGVDQDEVQSPTFSIINEYQGSTPVYHFDFYRIKSAAEAVRLGLDEYFYGQGVCLIEWPSKIREYLPEHFVQIHLKHKNATTREILVTFE